MIGVLFRVESSKQPWSRGGGEGARCQLPLAGRAGWGSTQDKRNLSCCSREGRKGVPPKSAPGGVIWSPHARTADFQPHIVFCSMQNLKGFVSIVCSSSCRAEKLSKGMISDLVAFVQKPPSSLSNKILNLSFTKVALNHTLKLLQYTIRH